MIAATLVAACVEPGPSEPATGATPPANRTWRGERPWHFLGSLVDARDLSSTDAPILFGENPEEPWDLVSWRVDASAPSGPVSVNAAGRIEGIGHPRFVDDLDGDQSPEVVGASSLPNDEILLFDSEMLGTVHPSDAWSRSATGVYRGLFGDCGDVNGDGLGDLCEVGWDLLQVWFAHSEPRSLSATDPDAGVAWQDPVVEGRGLFGLSGPAGPVAVASWYRRTPENETYLTVLGPDFDLATGVSTSGLPDLVASGDFAAPEGDEAFLWGGGTHLGDVTLYGVVEGAMQPTGCTITTDDDALRTTTTGAAGDFDGDGALDLALSALGSVFVFLGPFSPELLSLEDAALRVSSGAEDDDFAQSLAAADVDGDGRSDLVVGAPGDDRLARDAGAVYLWRGVDLFP